MTEATPWRSVRRWPRNSFMAGLVISFVSLGLAAPAQAEKDDCVYLASINTFKVIDDETLIVYASSFQAYRVDLFGICTGLSFAETIAIDSRDGRLCWPAHNHIIADSGGGFLQRCLVERVVDIGHGREEIKAAIAKIEEDRALERLAPPE